jgi:large subunit ribosomal protein L23
MTRAYDAVLSLLRTEKGTALQPYGKYIFKVSRMANKITIKKSIEKIYNVRVKKVNTICLSGKKRRLRFQEGMTASWKKAVVTLKPGHKIEVT